ncbi:MAG: hypothetical protein AAGJ53_00125, partial [Pseudomonadota bacterium]
AYLPTERAASRFDWIETFVFGSIAVGVALLAALLGGIITDGTIKEHSFIENAQLAMLGLAAIVFWFARRRAWHDGERAVVTACMIVMLTGMVRELDVKTWDGPWLWNWLGDHGLQEILMVGGGLTALVYLWIWRREWRTVLQRTFELQAWPFHVGAASVLIGGWAFDRRLSHLPFSVQFEEFFEFAGYALFAIAAIRSLDRVSTMNPESAPVTSSASA